MSHVPAPGRRRTRFRTARGATGSRNPGHGFRGDPRFQRAALTDSRSASNSTTPVRPRVGRLPLPGSPRPLPRTSPRPPQSPAPACAASPGPVGYPGLAPLSESLSVRVRALPSRGIALRVALPKIRLLPVLAPGGLWFLSMLPKNVPAYSGYYRSFEERLQRRHSTLERIAELLHILLIVEEVERNAQMAVAGGDDNALLAELLAQLCRVAAGKRGGHDR